MKLGSKALAIGLLLVGLVLINYLASSIPARLDTTAESIYSLSAGTKSMLGKVEEPVVIDLYFSKDASGLPIRYKNYATRVQEMLRQYVRAGRGKLTLNVINPRPDTPDEADAKVARGNAKLAALARLTPAQTQAWVAANVNTLADAKDVIATLAVAVSVLARRL
jgi:ABC-type uncharacterized transport system involved in gliding motility auxiliary subunit